MKKQSHFVTMLLLNPLVEPLKDYMVNEEEETLGVVFAQLVLLGKGNDEPSVRVRMGGFQHLAGKEYLYITSRFDICASSIVKLYLNR